jgi:pimeloyl-ACP methyl ester carboxylesterase
LVGHSVGGAIAMLFAARYPKMVLGIVNVEGNFTLDDAFWSQRIAKSDVAAWAKEYEGICSDPEKWLSDSGISPTAIRVQWAGQILSYQNAMTVQNVAKTVVDRTGQKSYLETVRKVLESNIPIFLYAGENSEKGWNVPEFVLEKAAELVIQPSTGHMMMLEDPDEFCKNLTRIIGAKAEA